jgi:hypothetical protein
MRTWRRIKGAKPAKLNETPILALTLRLPWSAFPGDGSNYLKEMVEREGIEPSTPAL